MKTVSEAGYPITFRSAEAEKLGEHLRQHNSIVIIGMKRVGISNFLRFFLSHPNVHQAYIKNGPMLSVQVDLNDLVEREIYPFWMLLLKRIVDTLTESNVPEELKEQATRLFSESIQLKDLFFTVDCVQKLLAALAKAEIYMVLYLIRFDRLKEAVTPEFFGNLQRLKDASHNHLSFIFTSFRPLYELSPDVFQKSALSVFTRDMYIKPGTNADMKIILETFRTRYSIELTEATVDRLISLCGGHVQYLQLALITLREEKQLSANVHNMLEVLLGDEEISLQSEELFANLTKFEQDTLFHIKQGMTISADTKHKAHYLWDTGMVTSAGRPAIFSPLFDTYLTKIGGSKLTAEFTKKEHILFSYLQSHEGELCEREDIIQAVWPEQAEMGVSDWAIDRLVSRVRAKLKSQKSSYEIVTVITRGYKLIRRS